MKFIETFEKIVVYLGDSKILDESRVSEFGKKLAEIGDRTVTKSKLVLDFRGVQFMSSAMIGQMVLLKKRTLQNNVRLKLVNVSGNVLEVFRIVRVDRVFNIGEDDDDEEPTGERVADPQPPPTLRGHANPPSS